MSRRRVLLLIQAGYSARNFILSGFLESKDFDFTFWSDQDYIEQYGIENKLIKLPEFDYNSRTNFLQKVKNRAELLYNVKRTGNKNYLHYLLGIQKNSSLRSKLKSFLINIMARRHATEKGILGLDTPFYKSVRKSSYYQACKEQLLEPKS